MSSERPHRCPGRRSGIEGRERKQRGGPKARRLRAMHYEKLIRGNPRRSFSNSSAWINTMDSRYRSSLSSKAELRRLARSKAERNSRCNWAIMQAMYSKWVIGGYMRSWAWSVEPQSFHRTPGLSSASRTSDVRSSQAASGSIFLDQLGMEFGIICSVKKPLIVESVHPLLCTWS